MRAADGFVLSRLFGLLCWWVLAATLCGGCAPRVATTVAPGEDPIEVQTIAVYPFQVQYRSDPALTYQKTVDLVSAALEPRRFQVYSFGDFQLFTLDTLDVYEGRSLLATVAADKIDIQKLAILRGEAVTEAAEGPHDEQRGSRSTTGRAVKAWVELYHYGLRRPIARAEHRFQLDPFDATQVDPYPELTRQVRRLAETVMSLALKRAIAPEPHRALPVAFYADHSTLFRVASDDAPSIARRMLTLDEVDKATHLLQGYQYFYPDISLLQVQRLHDTPGLLVTEIQADAVVSQGLKVGDLITRVNGQKVETLHQLDRQVARSPGGQPLELAIVRAGQELVVQVAF